jgi:23S rRNA pseudouridine2605 synthase
MKQSVPKPPPGDRPLKTLERILSKAGLGSRKEARMWIGDGRVQVNGNVVRDPDAWIDVERDSVAFDGEELRNEERVYLLLHKPVGYLTTNRDPQGRPTIYDLLPDGGPHVSYVGRLDFDTSGLLILTNDTQFAERLTNPQYHVPKTYHVTANRLLGDADLDLLRNGMELRDGPTRPAHVTRVSESVFEITITEGRNRQVRRMVEALDAEVVTLVRIAIGSIRIGDLPSGQTRELTADEVRALGVGSRGWGVGAKP